jgi:fatty acid desaturase
MSASFAVKSEMSAKMEIEGSGIGAASIATTYGAKAKVTLAWVAVPVALASTAAILLIAALSFAFYGLTTFLGKVPLLRRAYQYFSRLYDRVIDRLGQNVLRDPRDTPALRLMVSLTLTVLPIFIIQLVLKKPQLPLVVAFYLSLYGPKFRRFVRLFSAKHLEAHRRQGYFSEKFNRFFGRYFEFFLGYLYGNVPELDRTVHVRLHHKENGGFDDTAQSRGYDRTSRRDFLWYLSKNIWTVLGTTPYAYFKERGEEENRRRLLRGMAQYYIYFLTVFIYDWRIGALYVLVPLLSMNFITAITGWVQHAFYDPEHSEDYFAHTVTVLDDLNFMNEGYHLCHHHRSGMHWTEMPVHFERIRGHMREAGSLVFRDMDFMGLFLELTLLRRMDVLAEKLIPWEPMDHSQKLALLVNRTRVGAY